MTRTTNARVAGFAFLLYIAVGITAMILYARATAGADIPAKVASAAQNLPELRLTILLGLLESACAVVLAVTLYSITRVADADLAMLAMICRVAEGLVGTPAIRNTVQLVWLAGSGGGLPPATVQTLGAQLLNAPQGNIDAIFFVAGSALFAWLFLRGRIVPAALAWLGLAASLLLIVALPLQLAGFLNANVVAVLWLPMLAYELPLGVWLLIQGAPEAERIPRQSGARS